MFDKNTFKDAFRSWVQNNPTAKEEDALGFCQRSIPAAVYASNYWLVEQSLQWFSWLQKQRTFDDDEFHDEFNQADSGRLLC